MCPPSHSWCDTLPSTEDRAPPEIVAAGPEIVAAGPEIVAAGPGVVAPGRGGPAGPGAVAVRARQRTDVGRDHGTRERRGHQGCGAGGGIAPAGGVVAYLGHERGDSASLLNEVTSIR